MRLTALEELHDFAFKLISHNLEGFENASVRIGLSQTEYLKLFAEIDKSNCLLPKEFTGEDIGGWFTYMWMGVKFYIHIDKTITE